jgi:hypothetical protein
VSQSNFELLDDGLHGDGAARDGAHGGVFNFGGITDTIAYKYRDDATYPGTTTALLRPSEWPLGAPGRQRSFPVKMRGAVFHRKGGQAAPERAR